jgi:NDP-hexose-3-ketoreductase
MLERQDIDAVYLPLPAALHAEWTERSLLAGKHVLVEKPVSGSERETRRLVELARRQRLVLMENFMFLHHRQHDDAWRLVAQGEIGELLDFVAAFTIPPPSGQDIRWRRELGGGALRDLGVYPLRATQLFLGRGLEVCGASLRYNRDFGVDVAGAALLRTHDGMTAQLSWGMEHSYAAYYEFWGDKGRLRVDGAFAPSANSRQELHFDETLRVPRDNQYKNAIEFFAAAVRSGDFAGSWGEDSIELARLVDAVRRGDRDV